MDYFEFAEDAFTRVNYARSFMQLMLQMFTERYELEMEIMGMMNRFNIKWRKKFKECKVPELEICRLVIGELIKETSVTRSLSIMLTEGPKEPIRNFKVWVEEDFGNDDFSKTLTWDYNRAIIPFKERYSSSELSEMVMVNVKHHFNRFQENRLRVLFSYIKEFASWLQNVDQQKQQRRLQLNTVFDLIDSSNVKREIMKWNVGMGDKQPYKGYEEYDPKMVLKIEEDIYTPKSGQINQSRETEEIGFGIPKQKWTTGRVNKEKETDYATHILETTSNRKVLECYTFGSERQMAHKERKTKAEKILSDKEKLLKEGIRKKDVVATETNDFQLIEDKLLEKDKRKSSKLEHKKKKVEKSLYQSDDIKGQEKSSKVVKRPPNVIDDKKENIDTVDEMIKEMDDQAKEPNAREIVRETKADKFPSVKEKLHKESTRKMDTVATETTDMKRVEDELVVENKRKSSKLKEKKKDVEKNIPQTDEVRDQGRRLKSSSKVFKARPIIIDEKTEDIDMVDQMIKEIDDETEALKAKATKAELFPSVKQKLFKESIKKKNIEDTQANDLQIVEDELFEEDKRKSSKLKKKEKNILSTDNMVSERRSKSSNVFKTGKIITDEKKEEIDMVDEMLQEMDDQTKEKKAEDYQLVEEEMLNISKTTKSKSKTKEPVKETKTKGLQLVGEVMTKEDKRIKLKSKQKEDEDDMLQLDKLLDGAEKSLKTKRESKARPTTTQGTDQGLNMVDEILKDTEDLADVKETKDLHLVEDAVPKKDKRTKPKLTKKKTEVEKEMLLLDELLDGAERSMETKREIKARSTTTKGTDQGLNMVDEILKDTADLTDVKETKNLHLVEDVVPKKDKRTKPKLTKKRTEVEKEMLLLDELLDGAERSMETKRESKSPPTTTQDTNQCLDMVDDILKETADLTGVTETDNLQLTEYVVPKKDKGARPKIKRKETEVEKEMILLNELLDSAERRVEIKSENFKTRPKTAEDTMDIVDEILSETDVSTKDKKAENLKLKPQAVKKELKSEATGGISDDDDDVDDDDDDSLSDSDDTENEKDRGMKERSQSMEPKMADGMSDDDEDDDDDDSWEDSEVTDKQNGRALLKKRSIDVIESDNSGSSSDESFDQTLPREQTSDERLAQALVESIEKDVDIQAFIKKHEKKVEEPRVDDTKWRKATKMVALEDYTAKNDLQISFKAGQTIRQKRPANEYGYAFGFTQKGVMKNQVFGFYPARLVVPKEKGADSKKEKKDKKKKSKKKGKGSKLTNVNTENEKEKETEQKPTYQKPDKMVAIKDYNSENDLHISFKAGQIVKQMRPANENGLAYGYAEKGLMKTNEKFGYYPADLVVTKEENSKRKKEEKKNKQKQSVEDKKAKKDKEKKPKKDKESKKDKKRKPKIIVSTVEEDTANLEKAVKMVALQEYNAENDSQISFKAGQIVTQQRPANADGLAYGYIEKGMMKHKKFGYYPANFVITREENSEIKKEEKKNKEKKSSGKKDKVKKSKKDKERKNDESENPTGSESNAEKEELPKWRKADKMVALQAHVAQNDTQLSFKEGQIVRQQRPGNAEGWAFGFIEKGLMKKQIFGYYPAHFVVAKKEYAGNV